MDFKNYKFFIFIFICISISPSLAQVRFSSAIHDLGTFSEDTVHLPKFTFEFVNHGKKPVSIAKIKKSCGCIKAEFNPKPIQSGGKGYITIQYDPSGHPGSFNRKLWVYFSLQSQPYVLQIKGVVRPKRSSLY